MQTLADLITQRCDEARQVIAQAWSAKELERATLLLTQIELLALQASGTAHMPTTSDTVFQPNT